MRELPAKLLNALEAYVGNCIGGIGYAAPKPEKCGIDQLEYFGSHAWIARNDLSGLLD
jgi:hypothetical protein